MLNRRLVVGVMGCVLALVACARPHSATGTPEARALVASGEAAAKAGDAAEADRHFNEALRIDPAFAPAHVQLAINANLRGDWTAQRLHLQAAVESDRDNPQYLLQYGKSFQRTEPQRFREVARSVVQKFPGTQEAAHALYDLANASTNPERRAYLDQLRTTYPADKFPYASSAMHTLYGELETSDALSLAREMTVTLKGNKTWAARVAQQEAMARARTLIAGRQFAEASAALAAIPRPSGRHQTTWILLRAEALAGAGRPDEAYTTVLDVLVKAPDDHLQPALERYGSLLKKTAQEQDADLWRARDAKAVPAAPFELASAKDGKPVRLSDYRGRVVLLAFWFPG